MNFNLKLRRLQLSSILLYYHILFRLTDTSFRQTRPRNERKLRSLIWINFNLKYTGYCMNRGKTISPWKYWRNVAVNRVLKGCRSDRLILSTELKILIYSSLFWNCKMHAWLGWQIANSKKEQWRQIFSTPNNFLRLQDVPAFNVRTYRLVQLTASLARESTQKTVVAWCTSTQMD